MSKKEQQKCPICLDHYTAVLRKAIQCPYCPYASCKQCISQYLLTTMNDPHCVSCKRDWNREFIDLNLTQTFRKGELRKHRRRVLMDRERGRLPAMQIYVEARVLYRNALDDLSRFQSRRYELKILLTQLQSKKFHELNKEKIEELAVLIRPIIRERSELKKKIHETRVTLDTARATITGQPTQEVRQFIMKCPSDVCRGFLSTAWKCGTCLKFYCADCHAEKAGHVDESHVCNEDAKATAAMIRRETKACPKCGVRISKIDGCFAKDTPILLWNGSTKLSQDIRVGDVLIGDDGTPRVVEELCSGGDEMFEVKQGKGMSYVVNSKHKLALKFSGEKSIHWSESEKAWSVRWFDRKEHCMKSKKSRVDQATTKEEAYALLDAFCQQLLFDSIIEITVDDYMKLTESTKKHLMGFKSSCIHWPAKDLPLDPYVLGLWLGDGINDAMSFAINPQADPEILEYLLKWCEANTAEIVHDEAYRFRIRRREASHGRLAIGHGASSSECKGCRDKKCDICDLPEKPYTDELPLNQRHPLKEYLEKYNLPRNSKYIPDDYLMNNRAIRLELLAGLIDTDGYVGNDGKRVMISQANNEVGRQIEFLARSLGFAVDVDIVKKLNVPFPNTDRKDYPDHIRVSISGENLSEIPTRVARKKCVDSNSTKDELRTGITVKSVGQGTYYGWSVSGPNRRFLLADFTVARNCDQMWCTSCQTTFSWNSGQILHNIVVHNPHYYEYLRRIHNGAIPREAGDVPCGGHPNGYTFTRFIWNILELTQREKIELQDIVRCLDDLYHVRIHQFPLRQAANVTQDLDIRYLMNEISEEDWGTGLERLESSGERRKEIGLILQTLLHVGSEKTTQLQNTPKENRLAVARTILAEMRSVRTYTNKSWVEKGIQMGIVVPQITADWRWVMVRKGDMKQTDEIVEVAEAAASPPVTPEPPRQPETTTVMVEIDGDIVEMTQAQAQQILA